MGDGYGLKQFDVNAGKTLDFTVGLIPLRLQKQNRSLRGYSGGFCCNIDGDLERKKCADEILNGNEECLVGNQREDHLCYKVGKEFG